MVLCLKVKKKYGENLIKILKKAGKINTEYCLGKTGNYLLIPLKSKPNPKLITQNSAQLVERNLQKTKNTSPKSLKESLTGILKPEEIEKVNSSYDIVGDIAVIDFDKSLKKYEKTIAWTLKRTHKNINIVAKRSKKTTGQYRIKKITPLVGENRTTTIAKEHGVKLKIDLNKAYYSVRYSSERLRILKKIKKGEKILIMFAGVGPFPIVFAKKKNVQVWANELNPAALKLLKENIELNKLKSKIKVIPGDAKKEIPKLKQKFDRIVMPLPHTAHEFLKQAFQVSKKGTVIHLYQFEHESNIEKMKKRILKICEKLGKKVKITKVYRTGYFGPGINRYCLDIKVL